MPLLVDWAFPYRGRRARLLGGVQELILMRDFVLGSVAVGVVLLVLMVLGDTVHLDSDASLSGRLHGAALDRMNANVAIPRVMTAHGGSVS